MKFAVGATVGVAAVGPAASTFVDLDDYLTFGDMSQATGLANRAALQQAVNDCSGAATLRGTTGTAYIEFDPSHPCIDVPHCLCIHLGAVTLKCGPEAPTFAYDCFRIRQHKYVTITGGTIEGPADPGSNGYDNAGTNAIHATGSTAGVGATTLSGLTVTGRFYSAVVVDTGIAGITHHLTGTDLDLTSYGTTLGYFADPDATTKALNLADCSVHGTADLGELSGHLVYAHPHVPIVIERCAFDDNHYFAIHHYGSGNPTPADPHRIIDCTFGSGCDRGILTSSRATTLITGGTFAQGNVGIVPRNPTVIDGSHFTGAGDCVSGVLAAGETVTIRNITAELTGGSGFVTEGDGVVYVIEDFAIETTSFGISHINDSTSTVRRGTITGIGPAGGGMPVAAVAYQTAHADYDTVAFVGTFAGQAFIVGPAQDVTVHAVTLNGAPYVPPNAVAV